MPRRASRQNIGSLSRGETHEEEKEKEEEKRRRRAAKVEGKGDVERVWNTAESFPPPCTRRGGWKMRWKFRVAGSLPSRARDRLSLRVWPSLSGNLYLTTPGCTGRVAARGIADGKKVFPRSAPACLRFFGAWNLFSRLRCNFFPGRRMVGRGGRGDRKRWRIKFSRRSLRKVSIVIRRWCWKLKFERLEEWTWRWMCLRLNIKKRKKEWG